MSFADDVKNEVARKSYSRDCCRLAELASLIKLNGSLKIINRNLALKLKCQNAAVARRIYKLLKDQFNFFTEIVVRKKMYLDKGNYYIIKVPPQKGVKELLLNCGLIYEGYSLNYRVKEEFKKKRCCRKAYLRGLFLGGASVNHPDHSYHFELLVNNYDYAQDLKELFSYFDVDIKYIKKEGGYLLYLKRADDITRVLNIIGAHSSLLKFENTRVYKEVRNRVNRLVNCETANLNKTVTAAQKQLEDIELIDTYKGIEKLAPSLREISILRKENPYASIKELGELLDPPLSKSGVSNRLRRIKKIAKEIRGS
ncbi:DNA-binding protein WhiA [Halonatronum saccharophilum]|uniref:DNA-binding protein WhiA n=1 Tax=Halonatronum saccharophilum TaxID=150060 RepID=UPI000485407C|nr:DNA-binding protein WhiA [Halonatronum saccharophilum]